MTNYILVFNAKALSLDYINCVLVFEKLARFELEGAGGQPKESAKPFQFLCNCFYLI